MQQMNIKMEKTLGVTFKKYTNSEFLNSLRNCLLIIDNSCKQFTMTKNLFNWPLQCVTKTLMFLYKAQPLSTKQVVAYKKNLNTQ